MFERVGHRNIRARAAVALLVLFSGAAVLIVPSDLVVNVYSQSRRAATVRKRTASTARPYSSFPHDVKAHALACDSCHKFPSPNWKTVRAEADAFPDITEYPKHDSCLSCHKQQFFRGARPAICSICHVNPSPRDSRRHPFPNPREVFDASPKGKTAISDFEISFNHSLHVEIVTGTAGRSRREFQRASLASRRLAAEESCAVCHKTLNPQGEGSDEFYSKPPNDLGDVYWLKKGTFKSSPIGHTTCFTCHSADSGMKPDPTNCSTCHTLRSKPPPADFDAQLASRMGISDRVTLDAWKERDSTGRFRHEFVAHVDLSCSTCHSVDKMITTDAATKRVAMSACATCHVTATADEGGALNYEAGERSKNPRFDCTKCHVVFGRQPIPATHLEAIKAAGGK